MCRGSLIPLIYRERETEREGEAETQAGRQTDRKIYTKIKKSKTRRVRVNII